MNDNPIKYSDLIQKDSSIDDLIKALDGLNDSFFEFSKSVKSSAESLKASLQGVSGATEEGRKTIRKAASETDKLTKAEQERNFAYSETAKQIAALKAEAHEQNTRLKLEEKLARSAAGSYDALSAQYSLNKMALNQMGEAEEHERENKRALEEETNALYEQMKKLQEATGKHQLNVGNYADATKGLRSQIMELTEELVRLRMEGKQDSEEYQQTANKAAQLKDAFKDAQTEVVNMANDTSELNSILGALGAAGGGFAAVTGAMSLFGNENEDVQEAQKKLQAAIALTNGITAIQNSLQKQSNLMLGINKIQLAAKAKAEALATKNTVAATIAQKAFNAVAKANPYVLLATALISVVGALIAFSRGSKEANVSLVEQDKAILNLNNALKEYNMEMDFAIKKAQAEGASIKELTALKRQQSAEQIKASGEIINKYYEEIDAIDKEMATLSWWDKTRKKQLKEQKDAVIQNLNEALDARQKAVDEATRLEQNLHIETITNEKQTQDSLTQMLRKVQDQRNALIKDQYDRERAQRKTATKNAIEDIQKQLKDDKNLTTEQRAALNEQIKLYRLQLAADLKAIDDKQRKDQYDANVAMTRAAQDMEIALMEEGAEKKRAILHAEYTRQIEDIDARLQYERNTLSSEQYSVLINQRMTLMQQYSQEAKKLNAEIAADEAQKEMEAFDQYQALQQSEIDLMNISEHKKTALRLKLEKERLQKILQMGVENGKALTDVEVQTVKNAIERINQEIKSANIPQDLYDVFGLTLNDDQKAAISTSMQFAWDALNTWMQARVEAANQAVEAANKEVDAAQRAYELELQAKANGYAADVENAKKELELQKENQKKALAQQQEAQAQQEKLQTIQQIGNLVTATAQIWGAFGATPYIAIPLIALMFGSFAASKIMAKQAASEQYAEGTVELLQGGSHASGHDIDLGTKPDGTRRRAEGGEFFAVINKRNSRRFRKEIPEVIHSLNDGTFADKYLNTFNVGSVTVGSANQSGVDLMPLSDDVRAIREQNARRYIVLADGAMVEMYKNLTRRVVS